MCIDGEPDADGVADEILRYLRAHRAASDTSEGIAHWWLARQRLEDAMHQVQSALDRLVADGELLASTGADGRVLYHLPPERGGAGGI